MQMRFDGSYIYRGWLIEFVHPPIPNRSFDWCATHPEYEGEGDDRIVRGGNLQAIMNEIDAWYAENDRFYWRLVIPALLLSLMAIYWIAYAVTYS